jgi:predicted nucleic acid-binding protein
VIFIDSNVPMYLVGAPHRHKVDAQQAIERLLSERTRLVTDAEVFQEILRRDHSIVRRDAIHPAFSALLGIVDDVHAVDLDTLQRAKALLLGSAHLSPRDALHVAVMEQHGIEAILSFDQGFDAVPGIRRIR